MGDSPIFYLFKSDECHEVRANAFNAPAHLRRFRSIFETACKSAAAAEDATADLPHREMHIFTPSYTHTPVHKHVINT